MQPRTLLALTALALGSALAALPAAAQNAPLPSARGANDGGMISSPNEAQYNSNGAVTAAPANEMNAGACARYHSFDPSTGTYLGRDGRRHSCP